MVQILKQRTKEYLEMYSNVDMQLYRSDMVDAVRAQYSASNHEVITAGSGASADCLLVDYYAIKVMDSNDWCGAYYDLCERHTNPHSPIVFNRLHGPKASLVILERLYPAKLSADDAWVLSRYAEDCLDGPRVHATEPLQKSMRGWLSIVRDERKRLRSASDGVSLPTNDAHRGNWMRRLNGTLVLTDPWY